MTGRENVHVNGMLLGLSRDEVAERFDDIVAFAELAEVIDTPVKFYSSGMFMRLGFSVAVHVDPQVLLVDEVLAVGDIAFQLKCFDRMRALQAGGTTIVLVSHSMHAIRLLCPRVLLLRDGHLDLDGDSEAAIARHHDLLGREGGGSEGAHLGQVELLERGIEDKAGPVTSADAHDAAALRRPPPLPGRCRQPAPVLQRGVRGRHARLRDEVGHRQGRAAATAPARRPPSRSASGPTSVGGPTGSS